MSTSSTKKKKLPPLEYAGSLEHEELVKKYAASIERNQKGTKGGKQGRTGAKQGRNYKYGKSNYNQSIVYPNVVSGRGAYGLKGGVNFGHEGDWLRGGLSGFYNSAANDVVSGRGAYKIKRNTLWEGNSAPLIENITNGPVVIRHREYIGDMTCPTGAPSPYQIFFQQPINPGNPQMFPWLSTVAAMFQEWEALGIIFEIKTMSSDYTANVSMGTVFAAADYNVQSTAPANKQQLENMEYSQSCKPSCSILMPIECEPVKTVATHLYVAPNLEYSGGDPQFYDLAQVFLGSQGLPNAGGVVGTIAELWVSYEIVLYKPKISIITESGEEAGFYIYAPTVSNPFGSGVPVVFQGNQSQFIKLDTVNQQIILPPVPNQTYTIDYYLCADTMLGTEPTADLLPFTWTLGNVTATTPYYPSGGSSPLISYFDTEDNITLLAAQAQYGGYQQAIVVKTNANVDVNHPATVKVSAFNTWPDTMTNPNASLIIQHTGLYYA